MAVYHCVLFDLDGTLLDFGAAEHGALLETLEHFGLPATEQTEQTYRAINDGLWAALERGEIRQEKLVVRRFEKLQEELGGTQDPVQMNAYYLAQLAQRADVYPEVENTLRELAEVATLVVVSNGVEPVSYTHLDVYKRQVLIVGGMNPLLALVFAFIAGMLTGLVTGVLHTCFGIPAILSGILTQLALYSINMRIMGKSNVPLSVDQYPLTVSLRYIWPAVLVGIIAVAIVVAALYWFFGTEIGCAIRATGNNQAMARAQGVNTNAMKVLGLVLSNGPVSYTHLDVYKRQLIEFVVIWNVRFGDDSQQLPLLQNRCAIINFTVMAQGQTDNDQQGKFLCIMKKRAQRFLSAV